MSSCFRELRITAITAFKSEKHFSRMGNWGKRYWETVVQKISKLIKTVLVCLIQIRQKIISMSGYRNVPVVLRLCCLCVICIFKKLVYSVVIFCISFIYIQGKVNAYGMANGCFHFLCFLYDSINLIWFKMINLLIR